MPSEKTLHDLLYPQKASRIRVLSEQTLLLEDTVQTSLANEKAIHDQLVTLQAERDRLQAESDTTIHALKDSISILSLHLDRSGLSLAPAEALAALKEGGVDEALLLDLTTQLGWDQLAAYGSTSQTSQERQRAVDQSVRLWRYSPLYQWSVWLWTGWGLGDNVTAKLPTAKAQKWWDEFFLSRRNRSLLGREAIHRLSDWLLIKGNRFLALFTAKTGENAGRTTIRLIEQSELSPIYNPHDKADIWFWKRTWHDSSTSTGSQTYYYPSWETSLAPDLGSRWAMLQTSKKVPADAKRADLTKADTNVCILHVAHNQKEEGDPLGWPLSTTSAPWIRGHKQFAEARLGVALAIAQFVRRTQVEGGSRAVESVINTIASTLSRSNYLDGNPPGAAGSWHVENKASNTKELPMRTGASDAKADNEQFSWMALLGSGLFPTSAGLDTSRWATALEMDKAQAMVFERYQDLWIETMETLAYAVLTLADQYGSVTIPEPQRVAQISIDSFSLSDFPDVASSIGSFASQMLTPLVSGGIIEPKAAAGLAAELWRVTLQALGINNASELASLDLFYTEPEEDDDPISDTDDDADEETPPDDDAMGGDETEETPEEPDLEEFVISTYERAHDRLTAGVISPDQFAQFILAGAADNGD